MTHGIHHITAISSSAQKTYDFYVKILGLRFVKKTVNFDSPDTFHLYFANEKGDPGTVLTFFPFERAGTGMRGTEQVTNIYFAVPKDAIGFWLERFIQKGVKHERISKRFGNSALTFYDTDGLQLQIVATDENSTVQPWKYKDVPGDKAIKGFYGAELSVDKYKETGKLITDLMGYEFIAQEENHYRYENKNAEYAKILDLFSMPGWPKGIQSAGTNHHIAFRVKDKVEEGELRTKIYDAGFRPTEIIDRNYFYSVYFREPNGVLFEIATDVPGFEVDEDLDKLGTELKIPEQYAFMRAQIEAELPELITDDSEYSNDLFIHKFLKKESKDVVLVLHGTGADERDLIPLVSEVYAQASILSLRGNVKENGMNRFFKRNADGSFDLENLDFERKNLEAFLDIVSKKYDFELNDIIIFGYSNGANFGLSYIFKNPNKIKRAILLHPTLPFDPGALDLKESKILITYGKNDPYTPIEEIEGLIKILQESAADLETYSHEGGHELGRNEIDAIKSFLKK